MKLKLRRRIFSAVIAFVLLPCILLGVSGASAFTPAFPSGFGQVVYLFDGTYWQDDLRVGANYEVRMLEEVAPFQLDPAFVFSGWNTAGNGSGTMYQPGDMLTIPGGTVELHMQYRNAAELRPYEIAYYKDSIGGSYLGFNTYGLPTTFDDALANVMLNLDMYRLGFCKSGENVGYVDHGDKWTFNVVYAAVNVTYKSNHASSSAPDFVDIPYSNITMGHGYPIQDIAAAGFTEPAGTTFDGWNTEPDGSGTAYAAGDYLTILGDDLTLYAMWDDGTPAITKPFEVKYYADSRDSSTLIATRTVNAMPFADALAHVNSTLNAYHPGDNYLPGELESTDDINGKWIFHVVYKQGQITIKYSNNLTPEETYSDTTSTLQYQLQYPDDINIFHPEGHDFKYWTIQPADTGREYIQTERLSDILYETGSLPQTLYAQWENAPSTTFTVNHYLEDLGGAHSYGDKDYKLEKTDNHYAKLADEILLENILGGFYSYKYLESDPAGEIYVIDSHGFEIDLYYKQIAG